MSEKILEYFDELTTAIFHNELSASGLEKDVIDFREKLELLNQSNPPQLEWLDIETAPKDGTNILITNKANDTFVCHYREGFWYSDFYDGYDYGYLFSEPTHWRPLPKPPEENEQCQKQQN